MGKRCGNKIDDVFFAPRIAHINWYTLCIMISEKREIVKNLGEFIGRQCLQCLQKLFSLGFGQHVDNLACLLWISNPAFLAACFHRLDYPTGSSKAQSQGKTPRRHGIFRISWLRGSIRMTRGGCVHVPNLNTFRNFTEFAPQRRSPGDIFWGIPYRAVVDCVALVAESPSLKLQSSVHDNSCI